MRTFLASVLSLIVGIIAVLGLASWRLDALVHTPEPVEQIVTEQESSETLREAIPETLGNSASDNVPVAAQSMVSEALADAVAEVTEDDRFSNAWAKSWEQTRQGWVQQIETLADDGADTVSSREAAERIQLKLQLGPVAELSHTILSEKIHEAVGDSMLGDISGQLVGSAPTDLTVQTAIPPQGSISAQEIVVIEQNLNYWPVVLGIAGLGFLIALLLARSGARWSVWLISGLTVVVGGLVLRLGTVRFAEKSVEATESGSFSGIVQPLMDSVVEWSQPQTTAVMVGGAIIAILGILAGFISAARSSQSYR